MYIVLAILIFGFLIFIHELGHFLTAKRMNIQVNEFAVCMGPVLWKKQRGETTYSLRAIPIGGFCAMEGEDETSDNPRAFTSAKWWKRLLVLAAGSFMNFLTGFVVVALLLTALPGFSIPRIDSFMDGCPLESASGLQAGDTIRAIDGERVYVYDDVNMLLSRNKTGVFDLTLERDGKTVRLDNFKMEKQTYTVNGAQQKMYGLRFSYEDKTFGSLLKNAWGSSLYFVQLVRLGLHDLVSGAVGINDMSGPVGIVGTLNETGKEAQSSGGVGAGVWYVLYIGAFIAVNLSVMNLLPLPALDGGRIFCLLLTLIIEAITRRKLNPKYEGYIHGVGMVLLLALMAYITFHDIFKW